MLAVGNKRDELYQNPSPWGAHYLAAEAASKKERVLGQSDKPQDKKKRNY